MVDFKKVRKDIAEPAWGETKRVGDGTAIAFAIAALAEVIQEVTLMEALDYDDRKILARKFFGIPEPEQADE